MIEITINDNHRVLVPSKWSEISADQLVRIEQTDKDDILSLFSILTGLNLDIVTNARDKQLEAAVFTCVAFIFAPLDWKNLKHSSHLNFRGKLYKVPTDFNKMMLGQKILLGQLALNQEEMVNNIRKSVAICMQPTIDKGKYNEERVLKITEQLKKENGLEVYTLSKFFFRNLGGSFNTGKVNLQTSQSQRVRTGKLYQNWLN